MVTLVVSRNEAYGYGHPDGVCIDQTVPRYTDRSFTVMTGDWSSLNYDRNLVTFLNEKLARYRGELTSRLNSIHNTQEDEAYWGPILDSVLLHCLSALYDRVGKARHALETFDSVRIHSAHSCPTPEPNSWNLVPRLSHDEEINQYLYAIVGEVLGINVEPPLKTASAPTGTVSTAKHSLKQQLKLSALGAMNHLMLGFARLRRSGLVVNGGFNRSAASQIMKRTSGNVVVHLDGLLKPLTPRGTRVPDPISRSQLCVAETDDYDRVFNRIIPVLLPLSVIENYAETINRIGSLERIPFLASCTGLHSNDTYKILAARIRKSGGKVLSIQHGGAYGVRKDDPIAEIEITNADLWYPWGRIRADRKLMSPKLSALSRYRDRSRAITNRILFVATVGNRYRFHYCTNENPDTYLKLLNNQYAFFLALDAECRKSFHLRGYPVDFGWNYYERWTAATGQTAAQHQAENLYEQLLGSKLFVTDYLGTTWIEAIYLDVPTVMYLDVERYDLSPYVRPAFEELIEAGIVHGDPESAASHINSIKDDVPAWWQNPKTQKAIDALKDVLLTESDDPISDWVNEFQSLLRG